MTDIVCLVENQLYAGLDYSSFKCTIELKYLTHGQADVIRKTFPPSQAISIDFDKIIGKLEKLSLDLDLE